MPYCTEEDLVKVLPEETLRQITDDERVGGSDELSTRIDEAIAQADGEIDTYLTGLVTLPIAPVLPIIRQCSCSIAIYNLYSRYNETIPDTRDTRYKDALRTLRDIRDQKTKLPGQAAASGGSSAFVSGVVTHSHFEETS